MAVRESYPLTPDRSSPAPPELPDPSPRRFQFHLRDLLAFMVACAVLATLVRYLLMVLERLPDSQFTGLVSVTLSSLAFGALLYFFIRGPFLAHNALTFSRRWEEVRKHRRELETWTLARQEQLKQRDAEKEPPQPPK